MAVAGTGTGRETDSGEGAISLAITGYYAALDGGDGGNGGDDEDGGTDGEVEEERRRKRCMECAVAGVSVGD